MTVVTAESIREQFEVAVSTMNDDQKWALAMSDAIYFEYTMSDMLFATSDEAYEHAKSVVFAAEAENQSSNA